MLFVAVHTDEGLVGYSDTFYMPDALRGLHPRLRCTAPVGPQSAGD